MNRGVSLMGQYQYQDAVTAFEEAHALQPDLAPAAINLAIARFNRGEKEQGDIERAGALLDEVLAREPDNLRALYFKAIVLQHVGDTEAAVPLLNRVVQQAPEDGAAWYLLGLCKQRLDQPAEAELLQAVAHRPYLYSAWYKLFQVAVAAKDADQAKVYMEQFKALRESPLGESIELPQYNQMGELALVQPLPGPGAPVLPRRYRTGPPQVLGELLGQGRTGIAAADFNQDGRADLLVTDAGRLRLLLAGEGSGFSALSAPSVLNRISNAVGCAIGDFDNDEVADIFVPCAGPDALFRGHGDGTFTDVTEGAGVAGGGQASSLALFLDADHDADLDLFVGGNGGRCRLFRNNADGTFTDIAGQAGLACEGERIVAVLPGDLDGDRDADLVLLASTKPARVFLNELLGHFRELPDALDPNQGFNRLMGAALLDADGDRRSDLLLADTVVPLDPAMVKRLGLGADHELGRGLTLRGGAGGGRFVMRPPIAGWSAVDAIDQMGLSFPLCADLDLDGDPDLALFAKQTYLLVNDGTGHFAVERAAWTDAGTWLRGLALQDLDGDLIPDLVASLPQPDGPARLLLFPGRLDPAPNAVAIALTGVRGRDGRTRSPATGFGARLTLRAGLREQTRVYTGLNGGPDQSWLPEVFGLGDATNADYLEILWPDGVAQVERDLTAGATRKFAELQRKISSCPVLFAWNGERFGFVTDFAGVGGLGYFAAPGAYSRPQIEEHVKLEPGQLVPQDGAYELRITEPMEEVAYVDRLELLAIDHPAGAGVFPDERLALTGPQPTHDLLVVEERWFPLRATAPDGSDCATALREVDRRYAHEPRLDRRFIGFCEPHSVELDFGDQLTGLQPEERVFLFINGHIEFPYSSTVYAASQAGVSWESIRLEGAGAAGAWRTIVPDAGVPGGMARTFTVDLTGRLDGVRRLRLTTRMEIGYDQIFIARDAGREQVTVHRLSPAAADFRRGGFALEHSPDGRLPWIYDYERSEPTAPFHIQRGPYTRYGPVTELLEEFDDRYVMVGPGDEIAVRFDATRLSPPASGRVRSFVLVSHAYCKDMDLYTATPETVEPLPFRGMSRYPYPPSEHFPDTPATRRWMEAYNTRRVE